MFRFVAYDIESAYNLLSEILVPLQEYIDISPYEDRLHASSSSLGEYFRNADKELQSDDIHNEHKKAKTNEGGECDI